MGLRKNLRSLMEFVMVAIICIEMTRFSTELVPRQPKLTKLEDIRIAP